MRLTPISKPPVYCITCGLLLEESINTIGRTFNAFTGEVIHEGTKLKTRWCRVYYPGTHPTWELAESWENWMTND